MRTIFLFALCIVSSGAAGNLYKSLSARSRDEADSALLPFFWYAPLFLCFLALAFGERTAPAVPAAVCGGVALFTAAFLLLESMKRTSLAAAVIIVNLNFLIPVILSVLILKERAAPLQLGGMILAAAVVVFLNRDEGSEGKSGPGPLILPVVACLANGLLNFFIKINETAGGGRYGFFAVLYGTASLCAVVCAFFFAWRRKCGADGEGTPDGEDGNRRGFPGVPDRRAALAVCGLALSNGLCFWAEGVLAGTVNAAAQFTVITAASIALSLLVGALFQREPLTRRTVLSFAVCLCAILCQAGVL